MSDIERIAAELAIRNLLARYCHCYDQARVDEYCDLFVEDGEFHTPDTVATGRHEIRSKIAEGSRTAAPAQHVTYNSAIQIAPDGRASGQSDFMYVGAEPDGSKTIRIVGRYVDEFVSRDGDWKFQRRVVEFVGPR